MKLEDQFLKSFFYPFLLGIIISLIIVISSTVLFTYNYIDKGTADNLINLEKKIAKLNVNRANTIIITTLLKVQTGLNEIINSYQNYAKKIISDPNFIQDINDINETYFKSGYDIYKNYSIIYDNLDEIYKMGFWFIDEETNLQKLENNSDSKKQIKIFSELLPNLYGSFFSMNLSTSNYYFFFLSTKILFCYPLNYYHSINFVNLTMDFKSSNPKWCTDKDGIIFQTYRFNCRPFYMSMQKAMTNIFDNNYNSNISKSIFVTDFYYQPGENGGNVFTLCIKFNDPLSNIDAYACTDINQTELLSSLDSINNKLNGYFFVNSIGFNHAFYFPGVFEKAETACESIFGTENIFFLSEKTYFNNYIQKIMTSNYNKYLKEDIFDEIYANGNNSEDQYFSYKGVNYNFSIYPIYFENLKGEKEHIFNIIYVYNNKLFYEKLFNNYNKVRLAFIIIIIIIIFGVFGSGILHIISLSFNFLWKYIVIPIKNVNYMLKGINIGGENRLKYLEYLRKKQDEIFETIEKYSMNEEKDKQNENDEDTYENNNLKNVFNNILQGQDKEEEKKFLDLTPKDKILDEQNNQTDPEDEDDDSINKKVNNEQKCKEENDFIEDEINFYNFNEELLQFRAYEIDNITKALFDLKGALILTSSDQSTNQIINYCISESIFYSCRINEGATLCQSNIGNLESQLMKYDNAIYHLATSLQDDNLKRFLGRNLIDELDENDSLLNKISFNYSKEKSKQKINILVEKQMNNSRYNFDSKNIGILINSRYPRLIHSYYKFFSLIQKSITEALVGRFMNTTFHNINYYHKIVIQYIYLCFAKNDLVKIGESILDYIEFLLKFKFKTSQENKYLLNIRNLVKPEMKKKQKYKRYIFDKIVNWFNLFDDYISYIRNNTSLGDDKNIVADFSFLANSSNSQADSSSQSPFLFKINIQRGEYLKGKFALICKNLNDALFYFIRAAKKKSIVSDGLIRRKSLKRIHKIINKLFKKYKKYKINKWKMHSKIMELKRAKMRHFTKRQGFIYNPELNEDNSIKNNEYQTTFEQEMIKIKNSLINDLNKYYSKKEKDIIIIIDFNIYNQNDNNIVNTYKIDTFIDQTETILDNYLSNDDKLGVFIYSDHYQIICPLIKKKEIDTNHFTQDLIYYKNNIYEEGWETEDDLNSSGFQNEENIKLNSNNDSEMSEPGENDFFNDYTKKQRKIEDIVKGLIETVNYSKNYLKMKDVDKNEKYIILFTDLFNNYKISDEKILNNFQNLEDEKNLIFLLVGKNQSKDSQKDENIINNDKIDEDILLKMIKNKYMKKSETINFENMKKIKNILSNNNVIKSEIIYPNEIYK